MGRTPPLPRARSPEQISSRPSLTNRTGGYPRGTNRMNHYVEESLDDVVHHVPGLDRLLGRMLCLIDPAHHLPSLLSARLHPRESLDQVCPCRQPKPWLRASYAACSFCARWVSPLSRW